MFTIGISTGKGGVGKTALAFNLAHLLANDSRVLAVDADPQSSLTWALGIEGPSATLADVLSASNTRRAVRDAIVETSPTPTQMGASLHAIPASIQLAGVELAMSGKIGRETLLRRALESLSVDYDLCILDSPPSLGLLAINVLAASDGVILPVIADGVSLHAIGTFLDTLDEIRATVNPSGAELMGVVMTMFSDHLSHHAVGAEAIEGAGLPVFKAKIGRSIRVSESLAAHRPLEQYDHGNPRAEEFKQLAKEIRAWLRTHRR